MSKYTVTLTQAHIRYTQTIVEVEADENAMSSDVAELAKAQAVDDWKELDGEDSGCLDIEVVGDHCATTLWRED